MVTFLSSIFKKKIIIPQDIDEELKAKPLNEQIIVRDLTELGINIVPLNNYNIPLYNPDVGINKDIGSVMNLVYVALAIKNSTEQLLKLSE